MRATTHRRRRHVSPPARAGSLIRLLEVRGDAVPPKPDPRLPARAPCPVCGHSIVITPGGRLAQHGDPRALRTGTCPGSGRPVDAPD